MSGSVILGVCKSQFTPLDCDGNPDPTIDDVVYCGLTQISIQPVLFDALDLQDPAGIPNRNCVDIQIDGDVRYWDITLTTCSLFDPNLDALLGYSDPMVNASNEIIGTKAKPKNSEQDCLCACGTAGCQQRVGLTVWSLNLCGGTGGVQQAHPSGAFMVNAFPALQFRPTTEAVTINRELNGKVYTARAYENPAFGRGPGNIIPVEEAPFDRCRYQFASDVCPPSDCDCGACSGAAIAPLPIGA